jgi:hypothetical protein
MDVVTVAIKSVWLTALVLALLAALGGCATGPTIYERAYDHCRQNGGQDYECDRLARDEAAHEQQQIADQIRRGQDAVGDRARPPHLRRNQPPPQPSADRGPWDVCRPHYYRTIRNPV